MTNKLMMAAACLALVSATPVFAQQRAATAPATAPQQAPDPLLVDPNSLVVGAMRTVQLLDAGRAGEVWDGASAVAKRAVTKDAFVKQVSTSRTPLGTPQQRSWWSVMHQNVPTGGQAPAGNYISVRLATRFSSGRTATELLTFRLDEDKMWRFAGYVLQ